MTRETLQAQKIVVLGLGAMLRWGFGGPNKLFMVMLGWGLVCKKQISLQRPRLVPCVWRVRGGSANNIPTTLIGPPPQQQSISRASRKRLSLAIPCMGGTLENDVTLPQTPSPKNRDP